MSVYHHTYYSYTITFQGLSLLEYQIIYRNLVDLWQDPTIQTAPISYQILELVNNLFADLSATACNIPLSSLLPTMINVPDTNSYFLISLKIQDVILTINLNLKIQKW